MQYWQRVNYLDPAQTHFGNIWMNLSVFKLKIQNKISYKYISNGANSKQKDRSIFFPPVQYEQLIIPKGEMYKSQFPVHHPATILHIPYVVQFAGFPQPIQEHQTFHGAYPCNVLRCTPFSTPHPHHSTAVLT